MRQQFVKIVSICKLMLLFVSLTGVFYGAILWISEHVQQNYRYEEPKGRSVPVLFQDSTVHLTSIQDIKNRLLFFYRFGE